MSRPVYIDMAQVEANISASDALLRARCELLGAQGISARMNLALSGPFSRQFAVEINRGTNSGDLIFGLGTAVANIIVGIAKSLDDVAGCDRPKQAETDMVVAELFKQVKNCLAQIHDRSARPMIVATVAGIEGGNA